MSHAILVGLLYTWLSNFSCESDLSVQLAEHRTGTSSLDPRGAIARAKTFQI
jgi:hypothetical protein